jgi:hypothetical protein
MHAVDSWAGFPARATPRPIVLLGGPMRSEGGFKTSDAKIAFLQGAVESAADVPEEALRLMRLPQAHGPLPAAPLRVTDAVLSEAAFATVRGIVTFARVARDGIKHPGSDLGADCRLLCPLLVAADGSWRTGPVHTSFLARPATPTIWVSPSSSLEEG